VCAVNNRRGKPDEHSIPSSAAWHHVARMLFPHEPVRWCTKRDRWLINRYGSPYNLKNQPASLLPGGVTYISGPGPGPKIFAPNELIAEVDRAYFRLSLQNEVDDWFAKRGFDLGQPIIPKHLFEAAVQADFGQLLPELVKPVEKGAARAKARELKQPRMHQRYAGDDALVVEGRKGLKNGKYPNAWQAAQDLAARAEGSATGKVHRLYKKILSPQKSRNVSKHI
jgi:hypothetical protein